MTRCKKLQTLLSGTICGIHCSALIEMTVFFSGALAVDELWGNGNRFEHLSPHPFGVILLLIIVQYGAAEALLCATLASILLRIGNMPEQQLMENIYDYIFRSIYLPLIWIGTVSVLGAIRSRQLHEQKKLEQNYLQSESINEVITESYQRLKITKESLELRLAQELHSAIVVYEAAKALETIDQRELYKAAENMVLATLSPLKFSLYLLHPSGLELALCHGWETQEKYLLTFSRNSPLYDSIVREKRVLCVVNEEDERCLLDEAIIAGPIMDIKTQEVFGMLKIEDVGVMGVSMRNIAIFKVLCEWIGMAYSNANKYQAALKSTNIFMEKNTLFFVGDGNFGKLTNELNGL